jgi:hypothetical protein
MGIPHGTPKCGACSLVWQDRRVNHVDHAVAGLDVGCRDQGIVYMNGENMRGEWRSGMGAIAEWLIRSTATRREGVLLCLF